MRVYGTGEIRNVAVLGHGASGKTSLVDALAFVAGSSKRHGSVKDGTALTDYTADEIERKYSINLALAVAEWMDTKLNLIDTPGYLDFTGEALAGVYAADAALIVCSGTAGVEVGTEKVWDYCEARGIPRIFCVSLMDKEHADFEKVFQQIKSRLTANVIPVEIPVGEGPAFHGIINLFSKQCHFYKKGTKSGEYDEVPIPPEYQARFEKYTQQLTEAIAATDDSLLERYLAGDEIGRDEAIAAMKAGMARGELFPLFCASGELTYGARALLSKLVELCPSPAERPEEEAQLWGSAGKVTLSPTDGGPFVAQVFKTVSEPHVGDVTFFRVHSGTVKNGQEVWNAPREASEKLNHLCVSVGKDRTEIPELKAGDIGCVAKLRDTHTNDTLSTREKGLVLPKIPFPEPVITVAVQVKQRGEEDKLSTGLHKLHEEDPTFQHEYNAELGQTLMRGLGERHLEIVVGRLARKFGVHADMAKPKVAYRETLKGKAEGQGKHKKQTGGHGQYGDCHVRLKPLPRGSGYVFTDAIVGGVIPGKFIPSVDKGVQEAAKRGILAGYPVVDFEAECFFGSYHAVDSSDIAFQMAGIQAFNHAAEKAQPIILEPIIEVEVITPDQYMGDVIGDLNHRRGKVLGMDQDGSKAHVRALVPQAELENYATMLRSLTQGRAYHKRKLHAYEEVPKHVEQKIIEQSKKEKEEAHA